MKKSRIGAEQIVRAIHDHNGCKREDICRELGVSQASFYAWTKAIYDRVEEIVSYARSWRRGQTFGAYRFDKALSDARTAARCSQAQWGSSLARSGDAEGRAAPANCCRCWANIA